MTSALPRPGEELGWAGRGSLRRGCSAGTATAHPHHPSALPRSIPAASPWGYGGMWGRATPQRGTVPAVPGEGKAPRPAATSVRCRAGRCGRSPRPPPRPALTRGGAVGARRVARPLEQLHQRLPAPLLRHGGGGRAGGAGLRWAPPRLKPVHGAGRGALARRAARPGCSMRPRSPRAR